MISFTFLFGLFVQLIFFDNGYALADEVNDSEEVEIFQNDGGSGIIPKPGSGTPPSSATDRGGALQLTLLGLLLLFPIVAILSVRRQGKKARKT